MVDRSQRTRQSSGRAPRGRSLRRRGTTDHVNPPCKAKVPAMPDADLIGTPFLESLADSLCSALADNGDGLPIHIAVEPEGPSVGVLPLDGRAPTDLLLGATAPLDWW